MTQVDWTIVRTAASAGLLLLVPGALVAGRVADGRSVGGWAWLFLALVIAGFTLCGLVAGRLRSDTPMLHGALGAAVAFVFAQLFGTVVNLAGGGSVDWAAIVLTAPVALAAGVGGALLGDRLHRRSLRPVHRV